MQTFLRSFLLLQSSSENNGYQNSINLVRLKSSKQLFLGEDFCEKFIKGKISKKKQQLLRKYYSHESS